MKLEKINTEKDITEAVQGLLPGAQITVSYDTYKELEEVTIVTADGKFIRFRGADCSGRVNVHIKAKPELVKKWELSGKVFGALFVEHFDHEHEAKNRLNELEAKINLDEDATLEIKQVTVQREDK
jgi:hypothetical protein